MERSFDGQLDPSQIMLLERERDIRDLYLYQVLEHILEMNAPLKSTELSNINTHHRPDTKFISHTTYDYKSARNLSHPFHKHSFSRFALRQIQSVDMLSFLFTAIFISSLIFPFPSQAELSPTDLKLITKVAHSPVVDINTKKSHLPRNCDKPCFFLANNATSGGDCFTLMLTTPTCLYFPL